MWKYTRSLIGTTKYYHRFRQNVPAVIEYSHHQIRGASDDATNSSLFKPVSVKANPDTINVGVELVGKIKKTDLLKVLNNFSMNRQVKTLCKENGLDTYLQQQAFASFRRFCLESSNLPVELHIVIADVLQGSRNSDDLYPLFMAHARDVFPHLNCMDELLKISDLRTPASWYPEARRKARRIIFHAGPTNSGKTYNAMKRFLEAKSGVYCGPLKLLATEVFNKSNSKGTTCDLVTGEERRFGNADGTSAAHVACTVEMTSLSTPYEVAVIDEIQLLKDPGRGWAWTRAFLGLIADEIHVCGEAGSIDLLDRLCQTTGEIVETNTYERLTDLTVEDKALGTLDNVLPGDCIVCFSKNDIYKVSREIESRGKEIAVIYGSLPPNTKLMQAAKFNDPNNSCKIMVATDAIGMGLNLSIRRIIFYSITKPFMNEKGEKEIDTISISQALQIAGRAGRFGTQWEHGYVTTFNQADLPTIQLLLSQKPEPLERAGLHPTADQIELYAYHLPNATLSNLIDIFVSLCTVDELYFMCALDDFKYLAEMIQHVPLPLRARYVFCCSPINRKMPFVCSMFLKFARQYSKNEPITFKWVAKHCGWPLKPANTIVELMQLESIFDVMDLYLWLSYRFPDMFTQAEVIRAAQTELDELIQNGVLKITRLLKNTEINQHLDIGAKSGNKKTEMSINLDTNGAVTDAIGAGKFTSRLLKTGMITPQILDRLKNEWLREQKKATECLDNDRKESHDRYSQSKYNKDSNDRYSQSKYNKDSNDRYSKSEDIKNNNDRNSKKKSQKNNKKGKKGSRK